MKENKGNTMRFDRVKEHQFEFLVDFSHKAGESYLLISFNELKEIILVEISMFEVLRDKIKKKSFSISDLRGFPDNWIAEIGNYERKPEDKKFRNRCLDLTRFL
jgi:penicillin-binding protein-related factor A (putative recombinase)